MPQRVSQLLAVSLFWFVVLLLMPGADGALATGVVVDRSEGSVVSVVMKDRSIKLSVRTVVAGKVTFAVRNAGTMGHEFVVMRSDRHHHLLHMTGQQAREAGVRGEIEPFGPATTKRLTVTLTPGRYVLICNLPGHYKRGQFVALVVSPAASAPQTTEVGVSMFEMGFKLSKTRVPWGTVVFNVKNDGKLPHDFSFGSRGGGSPLLQAGQSATFTVKFATPGKYTFICTVEGHYAAGMYGVLTVF